MDEKSDEELEERDSDGASCTILLILGR